MKLTRNKIFNATGQLVYDEPMNINEGSTSEMIGLPASLKTGVYYLQLSNAEMNFGKKIILK